MQSFTTFGDLLKYLRRRAGLSQRDLSIAVGYSESQISRFEGNQRPPDAATLAARFAPALQLEDEPETVARLLELAAAARDEPAPGPGPSAPPDIPGAEERRSPGESPFKGLQYFDTPDADLFFGRERLTAKLVARLTSGFASPASPSEPKPGAAARFLAVVGASGSGKSSLVRAGLVPALQGRLPPSGDGQSAPSVPGWDIHVITPAAHPLQELAVSLTRGAESVTATTTLLDDLARDARVLSLYVRRLVAPPALPRPLAPSRVLLVIDQFEELFTACKDEAERRAFIENVLAAVEGDGPLSVVITLRADFYAHCAQYAGLRAALAEQQEFIGPMSADELRQAIEEPAKRGGWEWEPGLVELLLREVGDEPGALPLLSHALLETWQRRQGRRLTFSGYAESGGVRGAIARTAEGVYQALSPQGQATARRLFLRLTELGEGTQDTRRRAALAELIPTREDAAAEAVLQTLADARLITTSAGTAEVAHEALIREWGRLREWLTENREGLRLHRHLTEAAQAWERLKRDPGELYRGARLAQALEWADWSGEPSGDLNMLEREFLLASQALAEREAAEREAQRQHELEAAQALAEAQHQRAEEQARATGRLRARNRVITTIGAAAVVLALAALFFGLQAQRQANLALSRQLAAQASSRARGQFDLAALLSLEALGVADTVEARSTLLGELQDHFRISRYLRGQNTLVTNVAFSPDGKTLASAYFDNSILLWEVATRQPLGAPLIGNNSNWNPTNVAFSPDGKTLASGSINRTAILWNLTTHQRIGALVIGDDELWWTVAFSPDGRTVASGSASVPRPIILWDTATRQPLGAPLAGFTGQVNTMAFSPDGKTLAAGSTDHTIFLWDVTTRQMLGAPLTGHTGAVNSLAFSPDGKTLASGSDDHTVILWDVATRQPLGAPLAGHTDKVRSVAFSPDGKTLASGSSDQTIILWDVAERQPLGPPLAGHHGSVVSVAFSPDGKTLASGGWDGNVILWDVATQQTLGTPLTSSTGSMTSVAVSPDGRTLAWGGWDKTITLWDMTTHKSLGAPLAGHADAVSSLALSPDGKTLASGSRDKTIILWDLATHQPIGAPLTGHTDYLTSLAFSPQDGGRTLASGGNDGTIILWDVATRQPLGAPLTGHTGSVTSVAFSPDGKTLASASFDKRIFLWDVATRKQLGAPLTGHAGGVTSVAFSPDGKTLASGSYDNTILLWDVATRKQLGVPLTGHSDTVSVLAFSPDGKTLASGSFDNTIMLWDIATGQPIGHPFTGHTGRVISLAFSPDSSTLISGSWDDTILAWDVSVNSWQARACASVARNLTRVEWQQYLPDQPYHQTCAEWPEGK